MFLHPADTTSSSSPAPLIHQLTDGARKAPRHGSEYAAGHLSVHYRASSAALPGGAQAVGGLHDPRQGPELPQPAAPRLHGLTFLRGDAAAHPAGKRTAWIDVRAGQAVTFTLV